MYTRIGLFGPPAVAVFAGLDTANLGPQIRGFGFLIDRHHIRLLPRRWGSIPRRTAGFDPDAARRERRATSAFDSDLAPIVGQQITLNQARLTEGVFTLPWTAIITCRRALGSWTDLIRAENLNEPTARKDSSVATAIRPDF
jgi:hypothetical protein